MSRDSSVIILGAGYSSRMNSPKFALLFDQNQTFLERITDVYYQFGCKEILCVLNSEGIRSIQNTGMKFALNVRYIENRFPEKERFYSIQTGLIALTNFDSVFIQNIDNPFTDQQVLKTLYNHKREADYIVPVFKGKGGHPILINKRIRNALISSRNEKQDLKTFLKAFRRKQVTSTKHVMININSKQDYLAYFNERLFSI
jgi:molybdenum cofactor cytidylyltransferase